VLDFKTAVVWDRWRGLVSSNAVDFLESCPIVRTPSGGAHIWCRLPVPTPGMVLARDKDKGTLVEIRGEGHQVLAPGCPASCHKTCKTHEFLQEPMGRNSSLPLNVFSEWCYLAASLSEWVKPPDPPRTTPPRDRSPTHEEPGTDFNQRGTWEETGLFGAGWTWARRLDNDSGFVCRPGKSEGISGTVGIVRNRQQGWPLFHVFTTNGHPFEAEQSYDRFGVYTRLDHRGDFHSAARELAERGYGQQSAHRPRASVPALRIDVPKDRKLDRVVLPFTDTDIANGRRFVAEHGDNVRFVADWNRWVVFDGKRWSVDKSETLVQRLAKETTDRMAMEAAERIGDAAKLLAEAAEDEDKTRAEKNDKTARCDLKHAKRSRDIRAVKRLLESAKSEPLVNIQCGRDVFDLYPYLLNVQNGTIDLRTGELRSHPREDLLT
jgi:hypothetical protein